MGRAIKKVREMLSNVAGPSSSTARASVPGTSDPALTSAEAAGEKQSEAFVPEKNVPGTAAAESGLGVAPSTETKKAPEPSADDQQNSDEGK